MYQLRKDLMDTYILHIRYDSFDDAYTNEFLIFKATKDFLEIINNQVAKMQRKNKNEIRIIQ